MSQFSVLALAVGAACISLVASTFSVESSTGKVVFPRQTPQPAPFTLAMADFGEPKYGGSLMGALAYPSSSAYKCMPEECRYGCSLFNTSVPPYQVARDQGPVVMLIDRGPQDPHSKDPCYFLVKVYNAQMAGASAVLIVNDVPGADLATAVPPDEEMYLKLLPQIKISAALISMEDGAYLKALLRDNTAVMVQLSWRDILPKRDKVVWELWTNSNDECETMCDEQKAFISAMKPLAKKLEMSNQTSFTPHYLIWSCPKEFADTVECKAACVGGGAYCAQDPDGNLHDGYSGLDVLEVNLAQLCFFRVAQAAGSSWLWWSYVDAFGDMCKMADLKFNRQCAAAVASSVLSTISADAAALQTMVQSWDTCITSNFGNRTTGAGQAGVKELFEKELKAQYGSDGTAAVSILPSVRVNGESYRGTLDVPGVMRAICAGFVVGEEPAVCNENWVSEDECQPGGAGYLLCNAAASVSRGRTRCINTFSGWTCDCSDGWLRVTDPVTGLDSCADVNECLVPEIMAKQPTCTCERCACVNQPGTFTCTGALENKCTEANAWNGCWAAKVNGEQFTACKDMLPQYRVDAAAGKLPADAGYTTCACPPCFVASGSGCMAACDLKTCDRRAGCPASSGGSSVVTIFFTVFGAVVASCAVIGGAYQLYLRRSMHDEVREIMATYMPLDDLDRGRPGAGFETATAPPPSGRGGVEL